MLNKLFMPIKTHHYSNGEVTVIWKPDVCIHSAICFKGLAEVFDPRRKPWIDLSQADTKRIIDQVKKCPSGALSIAPWRRKALSSHFKYHSPDLKMAAKDNSNNNKDYYYKPQFFYWITGYIFLAEE
jgi:uncharacterized Fe-S cluster protein YjdI